PRTDRDSVVGMGAGPDARVGTPVPVRSVVLRLAARSRPGAELVVVVSSGIQELLGEPILVGGQVVVLLARQPSPPAQRTRPRGGSPLVWGQGQLQGVQREMVRLEGDRRAQSLVPIDE